MKVLFLFLQVLYCSVNADVPRPRRMGETIEDYLADDDVMEITDYYMAGPWKVRMLDPSELEPYYRKSEAEMSMDYATDLENRWSSLSEEEKDEAVKRELNHVHSDLRTRNW